MAAVICSEDLWDGIGEASSCGEDPLGGGWATLISGGEGKWAEETVWFGIRGPDDDKTGSAGVVGGCTGGPYRGCNGAAAEQAGCCWALRALAAAFSCFLVLLFSALDSTCIGVSMHVRMVHIMNRIETFSLQHDEKETSFLRAWL